MIDDQFSRFKVPELKLDPFKSANIRDAEILIQAQDKGLIRNTTHKYLHTSRLSHSNNLTSHSLISRK